MIYTLTCNPSLDYVLGVENLELGSTNRSVHEQLYVGGKGINVSIVLHNYQLETCVLGFASGFTGEQIVQELTDMQITNDLIVVDSSPSRINVKIHGEQETEINAQGPELTKEATAALYRKLDMLQDGDTLVLSGSTLRNTDDMFYADIMQYLSNQNIRIVVDATQQLLFNTLKYRPFLIKPNKKELEELLSVVINAEEDLVQACDKLQNLGARNILVSLGSEGAFMLCEDGTYLQSPAPSGNLIHSVGAGDSMVAGFLYGFSLNQDYKEAFLYGICSGSASAFSSELAKLEDTRNLIETIEKQLRVF